VDHERPVALGLLERVRVIPVVIPELPHEDFVTGSVARWGGDAAEHVVPADARLYTTWCDRCRAVMARSR
jgi:hypothetical protein